MRTHSLIFKTRESHHFDETLKNGAPPHLKSRFDFKRHVI